MELAPAAAAAAVASFVAAIIKSAFLRSWTLQGFVAEWAGYFVIALVGLAGPLPIG